MLSFTIAIFMLLISPGPGVLSTAGVGVAFGYRAGLRYVFGLFLGTNLVALMVVTGLSSLVFAVPWMRNILLFLSTGYLLYLAFRIAFAGTKIGFIAANNQPGIRDGVLLQIINPKAYVFNTAMFSAFPFYPASLLVEVTIKFVVINLIWIPIHLLWLYAGSSLEKLDLKPQTQRGINIVMALLMILAVTLALTRI